jgi:hypothetical protein
MASARDRIALTPEEAEAYLGEQRTVICATNGRGGFPHLMPLWYVVRDSGPGGTPEVWAWTFAKSQKTRNLERDARATLLVEDGEAYAELRGLMLTTDVEVLHDFETVLGVGLEVARRYGLGGEDGGPARQALEAQARKRVALRFVERSRASWDHRKST